MHLEKIKPDGGEVSAERDAWVCLKCATIRSLKQFNLEKRVS